MRLAPTLALLVTAGLACAAPASADSNRSAARAAADKTTDEAVTVRVDVSRGRLGVQIMDMTPELRKYFGAPPSAGILVSKVSPDSPAEKAGIRVGDVIVEVAGKQVAQAFDVLEHLSDKHKGDTVAVVVVRDRRRMTIRPKLDSEGGPVPRMFRFQRGADGKMSVPDFDQLHSKWHWPDWLAPGDDDSLRERLEETRERVRELEDRLRRLEQCNRS